MQSKSFELGGKSWAVEPLDPNEQIEVECILVQLFGPALGASVASAVQGLAPAVIDVLRDAAGEGEEFDLAKLGQLDTKDPRIRSAWSTLLPALAETAGDFVREAAFTLAGRLDYRDILRLFELVLFVGKKATVMVDGKQKFVRDYKVLARYLTHDPQAKWELLGRAILVTYGKAIDEEPAEPEEPGDA